MNGPENTQFEASKKNDEFVDPPLEAGLRQVLRPVDVPGGFADRVMARALAGDRPAESSAQEAQRAKLLHWPQSRWWISAAVAAALVAGIFEGEVVLRRAREEQQKVIQATQEFQTTERITVHALAQAREQLQKAGVPLTLD